MFDRFNIRQSTRALAPALLTIGMLVSVLSLTATNADAAACGTATTTNCTATGTLTLSGGTLAVTAPSSLAWTGAQTGANLSLVDSTTADQGYQVNDATGSGAGWHVTMSATTFTTTAPIHTLANSGTFSTTGSLTSATATTAPTVACVVVSGCTLPTNTTTYPVAITTAATSPTASTIYDTSASTGLGNIQIGGSASANPVGWWLSVPASTYAGTYTSTVTVAIVSAP